MLIADRTIAHDQPPYLIAELGVNHDGSLDKALHLIELAATHAAHAVKFQIFDAHLLMSKARRLAAYQQTAGESDALTMLQRLQLSEAQLATCVTHAHKLGIHAIATVFSLPLVDMAQRLSLDAYKTASPDIIHRPLLEALASTGKPLIISTGASTLSEVARALTWIKSARARLAVLQCVSSYPTPIEHAALGGMAAIADIFRGPVGYSDHTDSDQTSLDACALGTCILEKHFTYNRAAKGPDHAASLEPLSFRRYADAAILGYQVRMRSEHLDMDEVAQRLPPGSPIIAAHQAAAEFDKAVLDRLPKPPYSKEVLPIEQDVRAVSRQSICTVRDLPKGHTIRESDLCFKRPGTGIPPFRLTEILGRTTQHTIPADTPITDHDLAEHHAQAITK